MKIVVLCGGTSTERDISLVTGTGVCKALLSNGHDARLLDVFFGVEDSKYADFFKNKQDVDKEAEILKSFSPTVKTALELRKKGSKSFFGPNVIKLCREADIVFMALHGSNGEDGKIQATFDLLGFKYTGSGYLGSAISMNKAITKSVLKSYGVQMPKGILLVKSDSNKGLRDGLEFPVVVKPCCGGSSVGVSICNNEEEYEKGLEIAFDLEDEILVEEYVKGREFSIGLIDGKALPIIEIAPITGFYDYKNKYIPGMTKDTCPALISDEVTKRMQAVAEKAYDALELSSYARIDFLMTDKEEIYCLEVNTLPGMTPTSLLPQEASVLGKDYNELCEELIEVSMNKYI